MQSSDHVFLIATHILTDKVFNLCRQISLATSGMGETWILYHQKDGNSLPLHENLPVFSFTDAILTELKYIPIADTLIPGSNHFSLLSYFHMHPRFRYYWYIENDIIFTGSWDKFFNTFLEYKTDLISSHIELYCEKPLWPWWNTLQHPSRKIPPEERISSFNPVYRLSANALRFIHDALSDAWSGHHEVLLPTLLYQNQFTLMDFGGTGNFVPPGFRNRFYTWQTHRWRPVFQSAGSLSNKIYHPVK
jgi:hypothetical protein